MAIWVIILLIIFSDSLFKNMTFKSSRLNEEIASNEERLLKLNAILKQSKEVNAAYESTFTDYKDIGDSDGLLARVQEISTGVGVNIFNIKPAASRDEGLYKVFTLKIEGQDDIPAFARLINSLSEKLKGISIERIQVNAQNKEEQPRVSILLNAVSFKE